MVKQWERSSFCEVANAETLNFAPQLRVADCTLRDGEQQAGVVLTRDDKVEIARSLNALGVYEIEAGTPASSREDRDAVEAIAAENLSSKISALARARRDDVDDVAACGCWGVRLSLPISTIQRAAKLPTLDDDKYLTLAIDIATHAKERGLVCIFSPYDTTRCDLSFLQRLLGELGRRKIVDRVRLVDTTGCATPQIARYLVKKMKDAADIPIEVHFHDDFGLAVANTIAGAEAGAEYLSVTLNGIGERAGNASLEETVVALKVLYGVDIGINTEELYRASRVVEERSGVVLQSNKAVVGTGAFAHESGMVVAALLRDPFTAECYVPELVGQKRKILYGKKSGAASIRAKLDTIGISATDDQLKLIVEAVKAQAIKTKRALDDIAIARVVEQIMSHR